MPTPANAPLSMAERLDPTVHAALARSVASLSHASALMAASDWALHLAASPGHCLDLAHLALRQGQEMAAYALARIAAGPDKEARHAVATPTQDRRFADPAWQQWPFNVMQQSFVLTEQWWAAATHGVWGVDKHHEDMVAFAARQFLDVFSPGNQLATNPVVLNRTLAQGGANLARGALHLLEDARRHAAGAPPAGAEHFVVGRDVGITPGKVVLKNRVMELIQYTPTTQAVHPEPILIVPAWIMKYYILDLSPPNSLIQYLVDQGHTVFCISWINPGPEDRDLGMDDYLDQGFHAALNAVHSIVPQAKVHAAGYCLGGTLLAIAAAAMARDGDERLDSMTLFAAQTDFTEPGELALFIDNSQISLLEAQMAQTGYLTGAQMAGAFQMLRSYDLLWSRLVNEYLLGERPPMNDLMAWNADTTRMPAAMHSQYLRRLYLHNELAESRYCVESRPVSLNDVHQPMFVVGTEKDHVAPWRSVYKLHQLTDAEITFVLTSGGHNAGIVSEPGHAVRRWRDAVRRPGDPWLSPDEWEAAAKLHEGSWWTAWDTWIKAKGSGREVSARQLTGRDGLCGAPGAYVHQRCED